jgi:hypothetical protein
LVAIPRSICSDSASTDAIVPTWASILVAIQLAPFAKKIINGTLEDLEASLYQELCQNRLLRVPKQTDYKGCSRKPVPMRVYVLAAQYLHPFAKSIMYAKRALQCHCTNRLRKTNLLQLFYTLVEDFKMKVMNKIAFLSYCFYPTTFCCCTRNSNRLLKYWTKKGNISLLFNQSAYNKQWLGGGTSNVAGILTKL